MAEDRFARTAQRFVARQDERAAELAERVRAFVGASGSMSISTVSSHCSIARTVSCSRSASGPRVVDTSRIISRNLSTRRRSALFQALLSMTKLPRGSAFP